MAKHYTSFVKLKNDVPIQKLPQDPTVVGASGLGVARSGPAEPRRSRCST
jgi:hypothetical protein